MAGGFIDRVRLKKTDSSGAVNFTFINWNQFTLNNDYYYEYTHTYHAYLGIMAPDMAVLDGEQYTFSLDVECINGGGYTTIASGTYGAGGGSPEPSVVITYNN